MSSSFGERLGTQMALAAQALGWTPQEFWTATPAEFAAATGSPIQNETPMMDRRELDRMLKENGNG